VAGSVAAAGSLGAALCGPQLSRLADRFGQHLVLFPLGLTFALTVISLVTAVTLGAPDWVLFVCGIAGGATMPQTGPMARARWSVLLAGSPRLHTAFSLESVADELCFVIGPPVVTALATQLHPSAGVAFAAVCAVAGSLWFASQRSTEPPVTTRAARTVPPRTGLPQTGLPQTGLPQTGLPQTGRSKTGRRGFRLAAPGLSVLLPVYVFIGAMFVTIDLSTVAFATRLGHKPLAGVLLGCYALGSGTGGLWYGSRTWRTPAAKRMAVTLTLTVSGVCTFWAMPSLIVLAPVIYLCGMTIAPTLIAGFSIVESTARPGRATEAMSWMSTGVSVGVACGATAAGFVLDAFGPRWGYALGAALGVTATLGYLLGMRRLAT
jgi:MFS family permease